MLRTVNTAPFTFEYEEHPIPVPGPGEVLLNIKQVGICGSDIQVFHGLHPYAKLPLVLGHECAAIVDKLGPGVEDLNVGDLVTVQPQITCAECYACTHGSPNACEHMSFMGMHRPGFFQEYCVVPRWNVVPMPKGATMDMAMLVEPVAVAANAIRKAEVKKDSKVLVVGGGTIGLLVAELALGLGAEVMITDILDSKLEKAKECGIQHCVNTTGINLLEYVPSVFNGHPDVVIDCAAVPALFRDLIELTPNSGSLIIVGNYKKDLSFDMQRVQRREIVIKGVMQYIREDFLQAVDMLASGKIRTDIIISGSFPLKGLSEAFKFIDDNPDDVMKVAIKI